VVPERVPISSPIALGFPVRDLVCRSWMIHLSPSSILSMTILQALRRLLAPHSLMLTPWPFHVTPSEVLNCSVISLAGFRSRINSSSSDLSACGSLYSGNQHTACFKLHTDNGRSRQIRAQTLLDESVIHDLLRYLRQTDESQSHQCNPCGLAGDKSVRPGWQSVKLTVFQVSAYKYVGGSIL